MSTQISSPLNPPPAPTDGFVQSIANLARATQLNAALIQAGVKSQAPLVLWPDKTIQDLEHTLAAPLAPRGNEKLNDVPSFIAYVKRHLSPIRSILYGDYTEVGGHFIATLDYHGTEGDRTPGWSEHTAQVLLQVTPEWKRWSAKAGALLSQTEFAELLEDNADDIVVPTDLALHGLPPGAQLPTSADLAAVALTLSVHTDVRFNSAIRLTNGSTQLAYSEQVNGSYGAAEQRLAVPDLFCIGIAPFAGSPKFVVQVRLRYRTGGGKASFTYQIVRPHKVVQTAWEQERARIEEATGLKVLRGDIRGQRREPTKR